MRKSKKAGHIDREITNFLEGYKDLSMMAGYAVFIHDTKGNIFDVNRKAEVLTGYPKKELVKMNVRDLHIKRERKLSASKLYIIENIRKRVEFTAKFLRKNGEIINVRIIGDKFRFKEKHFVIGLVAPILPFDGNEKILTRRAKKNGRIKSLDKGYIESIRVLIDIAEARDPYTMEHSAKVTDYAVSLARYLGIPEFYVENIKFAAMLHDIGKVGIRKEILLKPSFLSKNEYEEVKNHPVLSVEMIKTLNPPAEVVPIIMHHHENYDGSGYPDGLRGEEIPLGARILSTVDAYDALTSKRAYRKAYSPKRALEIMHEESGIKFDPIIFRAFVAYLSLQKRKKR